MKRSPFSTGEAISISSPSGGVSKRSSKAAENRLREELFTGLDNQGNHIDTCNCEECIREKEYYIALILSSVVDEDTLECESKNDVISDNLDLFI